jgi:hypothetical protein
LANGIASNRETRSWYCRVTPTWLIDFETAGRNAVVSCGVVLDLKNSVAAVSPPFRILRASSKLILPIASRKICLACGAALSAARFMLSTNSSTFAP